MQRKIYRTKLRPERRAEYLQAHQNFSRDLMRRYRDAGMKTCAVYLVGDDLVLVTEAENPDLTTAILSKDPVDREWQAYVEPMKADGDWEEMTEVFFVDFSKTGV
jgi:L-rhamnose mutarotase